MRGNVITKIERIGEERLNNQGCLMKIVEYIDRHEVVVQFQDKHMGTVHTTYQHFKDGCVKNPYYPSVYGVGMVGVKYPSKINKKQTKEYEAWRGMLRRCFDIKKKEKQPTYKDATCCDEWLYYENFYDWLHSQSNFNKWYDGDKWAVDKDILTKGNKVYSPETCCLVAQNVNCLFTKKDFDRGRLSIGVVKHYKAFQSYCCNPFIREQKLLGTYNTPEQAFLVYKKYKERLIKQVAEIEYNKGNITRECYEAMMNYMVEIDD